MDWEIDHYEYKVIHYTYNPADRLEEPLITVILPVFEDNTDGLEKTLDSVFNQSYDNFEIIMVGNKCPKLNDFMNSYSHREDSRIKWINLFKKYDDNCVTLRNYGIKMLSTSKWIGYIDQGFEWGSCHLEDIVREIRCCNVEMVINGDRSRRSHNDIVHHVDLCYKYGLWKKKLFNSGEFYLLRFIDKISHKIIK